MIGDKPEEGAAEGCPLTDSPAGLSGTVTKPEIGTQRLARAASSEQAPATRYDLRVLQALRRIVRAVDLYSHRLSTQHKITGPQLVCLLAVQEHEPVTGSAIARDVHLNPSTVNGILNRLEAKGLIRRERDLKDRRLVHVTLTEQGKALVVIAPSPLQDTLAKAMKELPEAEQAAIAASLDRIVEMMEVRHINAAPILEAGPIVPPAGDAETGETPSGGAPGG